MRYPDDPHGLGVILAVRNEYDGGSDDWELDSLIRFDISEIIPGTIIISAELYLYYYDNYFNTAGRELNLHRITSDWDEDTVTWNTRPSIAPEATSFATVPDFTGVWMTWTVTDDVQDFVDEEKTNYGWQLMDDEYWGAVNIPHMKFHSKEYGDFIPYLEVITNEPPDAPTITGEIEGTAGEEYSYPFVSTDPEEQDIKFYIDWGDGQTEDWIGPYNSADIVTKSHTWDEEGTYTIRAKARDIFETESDWAYLEVTMPVNQQTQDSLILRFLDRFPNVSLY